MKDEGEGSGGHEPASIEERLEAIAERYLKALRAGETPDRRSLLIAHPDLGELLATRLRLTEWLHDAAAVPRDGGDAAPGAPHARCPHCCHELSVPGGDGDPIRCPSCGSAFRIAPISAGGGPSVPERIGRFQVTGVLGRGAFGVVYSAIDPGLGRLVTLKVPRAGAFESVADEERFLREARSAALLKHPGIVQVHEIAMEEGMPFIVREYVEGRTLEAVIREGRPSFRESAALIAAVAEAVEAAHSMGVVHRDIKPENIIIDPAGRPHVTDFGLARRDGGEVTVTLDGQILGTPAYMSPEQAAGDQRKVGPRSDVYSLGVILYELLTGERPFTGNRTMVIHQVLHDEPRPPSRLNEHIPRDLETICLKAMAKEPGARYSSAAEAAADVRRFLDEKPIFARPVGPLEKAWRVGRRHPLEAGLVVGLGVTVLAGITLVFSQWQRAERHATSEALERRRAEAALTRLRFLKAEDLFAAGKAGAAVAQLADIVSRDPSDGVAATRLLAALAARRFPLPMAPALRHRGPVLWAELSHDGARVVTASDDGSASIWDARTSERLPGPLLHEKAVTCARFSPDDSLVLTASRDHTARLWDAATGQAVLPSLPHGDRVRHAAFSPGGGEVVTACADGIARIWEARTGRLLARLQHAAYVNSAVFSPDGRMVATASDDGTARVWNVSSGEPLTEPLRHGAEVFTACFSPDGGKVLTASFDRTARLWDLETRRELSRVEHGAQIFEAEFSPDGQRFVTASWDHTACVWDSATGKPLTGPLAHDARVTAVDFSPDGQRVLTVSADNTARVWDAGAATAWWSGQRLATTRDDEALQRFERPNLLVEPLRHAGMTAHASFSPDGRRVVTASYDYTAQVWDLPGPAGPTLELFHRSGPWIARFSPDGKVVASAVMGVFIWDASSGRLLRKSPPHAWRITAVEFDPEGRRILTASLDGTARVWDIASDRCVTLRHDDVCQAARFSPDGERVITASNDWTARIWESRTGKPLAPPLRHDHHVLCVAFGPDGRLAASGGNDDLLKVWDSGSGDLVASMLHDEAVMCLGFSADGKWIATGGADGATRVWEAATARPVSIPFRQGGRIRSVEFSPEDAAVVTACDDRTARIWDVLSGTQRGEALLHEGGVRSARFGADGTRIVTASTDGTARVWDARTGLPLSERLEHDDEVWHAELSPDGTRVVTASIDMTVGIWESPPATSGSPAPAWLPRISRSIARERVNDSGGLDVVSEPLMDIGRELAGRAGDAAYGAWLAWCLEEPSRRTLHPASAITLENLVERLEKEGRLDALRAAIHSAPARGPSFARLSLGILESRSVPGPRELAEADWSSRRALDLDPQGPEPTAARARVLAAAGDLRGGLALLGEDRREPADPSWWLVRGSLLEEGGRVEEALLAYGRVVDDAASASLIAPGRIPAAEALRKRSLLLSRLGRVEDARRDLEVSLALRGIPLRDLSAPQDALDLSPWYNCTLEEEYLSMVPAGVRQCAGVWFDVRGIVRVAPPRLDARVGVTVRGIAVRRTCRRIHFLHTAILRPVPEGTEIGRYILSLEGARSEEIPIIYGEDLRSWWAPPGEKDRVGRADLAWSQDLFSNGTVRLFQRTWTNPSPEIEVRSIDVVCGLGAAAPALIAISVEP